MNFNLLITMFKTMFKINKFKTIILTLVILFSFSMVLPVKAFYLEIPQVVKDFIETIKPFHITTNSIKAEENTSLQPINPLPPPSTEPNVPSLKPLQPVQPVTPMPINQPGQTCNINGTEQPGPCPGSNSQSMPPMPYPSDNGGQANNGGPTMMNNNQGPGGPNGPDMERQMKDMKRGAKQMGLQLNRFETMLKSVEKKGTVVSDEIKGKVTQLRDILNKINSTNSPEELQDIDFGEANNLMQQLEQTRQEVFEQAQRMDDMKRNMRNIESNTKMFEKQLAKLTKQNIAVPTEVSDNLTKIKTIIAAVKQAKTWEEMQNAGVEDLQDLMNNLDQNRQQLEMLSRWPQTVKQMNSELTRLNRELKRSKSIVDRLNKKGIDLSAIYAEFENAINKLNSVKEDASNKIKNGDGQEAFDIVQNDFFGQLEDVWQNQKVISMMSNLSQFNSEFKRGITQANQTIRQLDRKKIDTTELKDLLEQTKVKANEVLALLKTNPIEPDDIVAGLDEMQNLKQEFESKVAELTGQEDNLPWENGPQQFKQISMPANFQGLMPQQKNNDVNNGQTCNVNGVETPGPCKN